MDSMRQVDFPGWLQKRGFPRVADGESVFYASRNAGKITGVDAWSEEAREAAARSRRRRRLGTEWAGGHLAPEGWNRQHQAAARHTSQYGSHGGRDAMPGEQQSISFEVPLTTKGYDPVTGEQYPSRRRREKVSEYDPMGRLAATFEEDAMRRPLFTSFDGFQIVGDAKPAQITVQLYDNIEIDDAAKVTFTKDGFMKAMPRVARTGIQIYSGAECGRPEMAQVRVYRPEKAVFDSAALKSLPHLPTTLEHPSQAVTAQNWKDHGTGETGDEVLRDGGTIRVPMMLRDAKAIAAWKDGSKKQLSVGYTCDLRWESGTTPDGQTFDAVQDNIRANRLAQCALRAVVQFSPSATTRSTP